MPKRSSYVLFKSNTPSKPSTRVYGDPVGGGAVKKQKVSSKKSPKVVKGYTSERGYYGRFNMAARKATGLVGSELKFFDTALAFTFDATPEVPATGQLNIIPQGATENTRVGRSCTIKSIRIAGVVRSSSGSPTPPDCVGMWVVLDKQCNGAAATAAAVCAGGGTDSMVIANKNLENDQRFVILKKFVFEMNPSYGDTSTYGIISKAFDWYHKCNYTIDFDSSASTGAIGTIRSNNIFLLTSATNTDDIYQMIGTVRVRFSDE